MSKKSLTEPEQRAASAWLDQELPEGERDCIEARLVEGDAALRDEIEGYRRVRAEFRGWFQKEVETESRKVDLWAAIEQDIRRDTSPVRPFSLRDSFEKFFERLRHPFSLGGLAAAAALMLFVFARGPATPAPTQLAEREALEIEKFQNGGAGDPTVLVRDFAGRLPVPESLAVRLLSSPQLITDPQTRVGPTRDGGFRTGNTDIEWIKTSKPFKLVASRRREAPPVIWVARTNK